jgi:hypothetical protein
MFQAHGGVLNVELSDPHVHFDQAARSIVSVAPTTRRSGERVDIASFTEWRILDRRLLVPAPRLTWTGVAMLGDFYDVGETLDPIEIELDGS